MQIKFYRTGQALLEYLLLTAIVAFIVIAAFSNSQEGGRYLSTLQRAGQEYFEDGSRALLGGYYKGGEYHATQPKAIKGGWCAWGECIDGFRERECACPAPAFGGANCQGSPYGDCSGPLDECPPSLVYVPGKGCVCPTGMIKDENGQCKECTPACEDRQCGSDGCGGRCGTCHPHQKCNEQTGLCELKCVPLCWGECGSDGCTSKPCRECPPGLTCNQLTHKCVGSCQQDCSSFEKLNRCGDDGCGKFCGCRPGTTCVWGNCISQMCGNTVCSDGSGGINPGCVTPVDCNVKCPGNSVRMCSIMDLCLRLNGKIDGPKCTIPCSPADQAQGKTECCVQFCVDEGSSGGYRIENPGSF